jgi:hypothetical protein
MTNMSEIRYEQHAIRRHWKDILINYYNITSTAHNSNLRNREPQLQTEVLLSTNILTQLVRIYETTNAAQKVFVLWVE